MEGYYSPENCDDHSYQADYNKNISYTRNNYLVKKAGDYIFTKQYRFILVGLHNNIHKFGNAHTIISEITNRENIEKLLFSNICDSKTETILALNSLKQLENLCKVGLEECIKYSNSRGSKIIILCSHTTERTLNGNKKNHYLDIILRLKKYSQFYYIPQISGSIFIFDSSKILLINDPRDYDIDDINAVVGMYTENKSIIRNYGSLLDTLLNEEDVLSSLISSKNQLEELNKDLLDSNQKLEANVKAQRDFINLAAHELRTPTSAILGYIEMLTVSSDLESSESSESDRKKSAIETERYMTSIVRNANRLEKLVEDLLDTSRIESNMLVLRKEKTDLAELVNSIIRDFRIDIGRRKVEFIKSHPPLLESANNKDEDKEKETGKEMKMTKKDAISQHLSLQSDKSSPPQLKDIQIYGTQDNKKEKEDGSSSSDLLVENTNTTVMVDRDKIAQVLSNLIRNSLNSIYNKKNSDKNKDWIRISISKSESQVMTHKENILAYDTSHQNVKAARTIQVKIKDTGKGIDDSLHPKLFEKFATGSASGSGLGLYISKAIIEAHGGKIWAENNNNKNNKNQDDDGGGGGATLSFTLPLI
jgi:signal transduction histidine kinase